MVDAPPGGPCELCEGTGEWSAICDAPDDCWQCHGTGVMRARGNCEACLGWGWTLGPAACAACAESGWIAADVALFWCHGCMRTVAAQAMQPACVVDATHRLERSSAPRP